jgi:hypothetical protein
MKTCQCCGATASADAPHCVRCGEASWRAPSIVVHVDAEQFARLKPGVQPAEYAPTTDPAYVYAPPAVEPIAEPAPLVADVIEPTAPETQTAWPGAYQAPALPIAAPPHVHARKRHPR